MTAPRRFVLTLVAVAGCSSAPPRSTSPGAALAAPVFAAGSSTAAAAPVETAPAEITPAPIQPGPIGNMTGAKEHAMANCPVAVPGARTTLILTDDGVALVISATSRDARAEIRRLAHAQALLSEPSGRGLHSGRHGGPGRIGYCPIVHTDRVIVTAVDTASGAAIRMRTQGGYDAVVSLQELVALRVAGLPPVVPPDLPATH
jgi:hypothetical protein